MKSVNIICAALIVMGCATIFANRNINATTSDTSNNIQYAETYGAVDGMFFSTANVVDYWYFGEPDNWNEDDKFFILYNDADAAIEYEVIRVDLQTYLAVMDNLDSANEPIVGNLQAIYSDNNHEVYFTLIR